MSDFKFRVAGIPCTIRVDSYCPGEEPSWDCPGSGPECSYTICDRRGRPAPWLDRKASEYDRERIESAIINGDSRDYDDEPPSPRVYSDAEIDAYADRYFGVE